MFVCNSERHTTPGSSNLISAACALHALAIMLQLILLLNRTWLMLVLPGCMSSWWPAW